MSPGSLRRERSIRRKPCCSMSQMIRCATSLNVAVHQESARLLMTDIALNREPASRLKTIGCTRCARDQIAHQKSGIPHVSNHHRCHVGLGDTRRPSPAAVRRYRVHRGVSYRSMPNPSIAGLLCIWAAQKRRGRLISESDAAARPSIQYKAALAVIPLNPPCSVMRIWRKKNVADHVFAIANVADDSGLRTSKSAPRRYNQR